MQKLKAALRRINDTYTTPLTITACFAAVVFGLLWGIGKWDPIKIDTATTVGTAQKVLCCGGLTALLAIFIYLLAREALRPVGEEVKERPAWYYPLFSGLLCLVAMMVAYSFVGMWPFGEKTGMVVDMHHQYAPLLAGLRDGILNGEIGLYNFEVGLGANYLSLGAYYLASPLNLLLLLFPESLLPEGILLITLIKNALCGAMFALCVQGIYKKRSLAIPVVSLMYSLMMYLLAYSWNIMWLDVLFILPLAVYGLERLLSTGKYLTYVLALAYALFANYYIAFMLCIFLVLYYIAYVVREKRKLRPVALSFVRFAGFSMLAAGLVAFLLIPVYLALKLTSAAGAEPPELTNTLDMFQLLGRHLAGTSPTIRSGNLPNLYCGVLAALCVPLFALNKGINLRRRLTYMALWLGLGFTFLINRTDLLWHGNHAPNDLPYRFSFVYCFLLVLMAYEVLMHLKDINKKHVFAVFAVALAYLMFEERFGGDVYDFKVVYANILLISIYTAILAVIVCKKLRTRVAYAILLIAVGLEMTVNAGVGLKQVNGNEYFTRHDDYVDNEITETLRLAVDRAQELGDAKYGEGLYRMEFFPRRTCVDTALYHYRGLSTFSSSNYYTTTKLMGGWGYAINGVNSHLYHAPNPLIDALLGIRYIIADREQTLPYLTKVDTVSHGAYTYYIYENTAALSLGYVVDPTIKDYQYTKYAPFASQEDLYGKLNDLYKELYLYNSFSAVFDTGAEEGYGLGSFNVDPLEDGSAAVFDATITHAGDVFVYVDCMAARTMYVRYGDGQSVSVSPYEPYILSIGRMEEGETVSLEVFADQYSTGNFYVMTLNYEEAFVPAIEILKQDQLDLTVWENDRIEGSVNASFDGVMMTSVPYDEGWTVMVDGKAVKTYAIDKGLLAFDVKAGVHTVSMTYTPAGWKAGTIITVISMAVLFGFLAFGAVKRIKARAARRRAEKLAEEAAAEALISDGDPVLRAALAAEEAEVVPAEEVTAEDAPVVAPQEPEASTPTDEII